MDEKQKYEAVVEELQTLNNILTFIQKDLAAIRKAVEKLARKPL